MVEECGDGMRWILAERKRPVLHDHHAQRKDCTIRSRWSQIQELRSTVRKASGGRNRKELVRSSLCRISSVKIYALDLVSE